MQASCLSLPTSYTLIHVLWEAAYGSTRRQENICEAGSDLAAWINQGQFQNLSFTFSPGILQEEKKYPSLPASPNPSRGFIITVSQEFGQQWVENKPPFSEILKHKNLYFVNQLYFNRFF